MRSLFSGSKTTSASNPATPAGVVTSVEPEPKAKARHPWRASIQQQHLLLILLIFLPLLIIQTYSALVEYQTQRQSVLEGQLVTARSISRTVTAFINDQLNNNQALGFSFNNGATLSPEQGSALLTQFRKNLPFLYAYRYIGLDGKVKYTDQAGDTGRDFSQEPFYGKILAGQNFVVTDLRLSFNDQTTPVFWVISAIRSSQGQLVGMMMASVDATKLQPVFDLKLGQRDRGSFTIHDPQAHIIFNSQVPGMDYQRRISGVKPASVTAALAGEEQAINYVKSNIDGLDKLGASVPIPLVGWSASVAEPIEDAMSPTVNIIVPRILTFLAVAFLAFVAAWFYSRYLTRPILNMRDAATAFGQGDLDRRISGKNHNAELEELALSFNQMAERIAEETRSRDAFLSQAAHELKTPITVIKASTQILIRNQQREQKAALAKAGEARPVATPPRNELKMLQGMEHQTNRMIELINRLLEVSRIQSGRMEYHFAPVNFRELVEQSVEAARQLTMPERHSLEFSAAGGQDWTVTGDSARLEQVILNLLENAIKYSPDGGPIQVNLRENPPNEIFATSHLQLTIQDQGLGLEPQDLNRLFERYQRAGQGRRNISGLGLGLYISAEIVKQHGGRLWATSPGAGQGSIFYLVLPKNHLEQ